MKITSLHQTTSLERVNPESGFGDVGEGGIVAGQLGIPMVGSLGDGQTWIYDTGSGTLIPGDVGPGIDLQDDGVSQVDPATVLNFRTGISADASGNIDVTAAGGRPPYTVVIAAADTPAALQAVADAVCDATADEVELNAAISAMVAGAVGASLKLLPGTYRIADMWDLAPLTAIGYTNRVLIDAREAVIVADADMTTMIGLAPTGLPDLSSCTFLFGQIDGNKASHSVTHGLLIRRFNDNIIEIGDLRNVSSYAIYIGQDGVSNSGCFNNQFEIGRIVSSGSAFYATAGTNNFGFEGNVIRCGQVWDNDDGFVFGEHTDDSVRFNTVIASPIEHQTAYGIYDRGGGNTWIINNLNSNGTAGIGCPTSMTRRSTFIVYADGDVIEAAVTAQHYVLDKGAMVGLVELAEQSVVPGTPASGFGRLYFKASDSKPYAKNDAGTEYDLTAAGGVTGFATPAVVLGTAAASGTATTAIRSDSTIVAFDATTPAAIGTAATGSVAKAARRDHVHATGAGTPSTQALGDAAATGTGPAAAMTDHKHAMPALSSATPLVASGSGAVGSALPSSREDHVHPGVSGAGAEHAHVVSETHLSNGSTVTWTLDQAYMTGSVIAWNVTTLARLTVTEVLPDQATVSAAGTTGDSIVFDYAAVAV